MSDDTSESKERKPVRSVLRALAVLEAIGAGSKGPSAIAAELGVSKGTVFDLLRTLVSAGYVRQDPASEEYWLGPAFARIIARGVPQPSLVEIAVPHLQRLSDETGEVTHLGQREGFGASYLHRAVSERAGRRLSLNSLVGAVSPFHCTAMGKIFMAHLEDREFETYLRGDREAFTDKTICDGPALRAERSAILSKGFSLNIGEFEEGVSSVAVPLRITAGSVGFGINFAMPSVRMPEHSIPGLVVRLQHTAAAIEKDFGAR